MDMIWTFAQTRRAYTFNPRDTTTIDVESLSGVPTEKGKTMDKYTATEQAYKNGYEKGYEAGKPKWIPVSERLPELDELVMCYKRGKMFLGKYLGVMYSPVVGAFKSNEEYYALGATHWMPLPEPPKEGE